MEAIEREPDTTNDELLNDTGELAGAEPAADPVHLAKCAECATAVRFQSNVTGTGFFLVDEAPDLTFGIGPNGRPVCPNGHGEMSIADDKIPAADAFTLAAERLNEAKQRTLPGCLPAFNYEAVCREMTQQAVQVQAAKRIYDDDAARAKSSKKRWDEAEELLTNIGLRFAERINARDHGLEDEAPVVADRQPCTWEAKHPTQRVCPICSGQTVQAVIDRLLGTDVPPPDAAAHADSIDAFLLALEREELLDALKCVDIYIDPYQITGWSGVDHAAALVWATATLAHETDADVTVPEKPAILGKPHIPSQPVPGEHQVCQFCEMVIKPASEIEASGPYKVTDYVGTDCPGKVVEAPRYPKGKHGKKPAAKKKVSR